MKSDGGAGGGGGLTEGDVSDGAGAGEDTKPGVLTAAETRDGVDDVTSTGDFENVGTHGGLGLAGNDDGRLGLILGARWAASGPANDFNGSAVGGGGSGLGGGPDGGLWSGPGAVIVFGGLLGITREVERVVMGERVVVKFGEHIGGFYIFPFHVLLFLYFFEFFLRGFVNLLIWVIVWWEYPIPSV